ncbi:4-galactosyl-N-acetylglucosaminide 3-alpha-L-fucosyltransferase 9-like [Danio aesculapii]|uniref:4-galactosyl-N-acetylglucosaminide 3-alpha-L-fucosyltransferase 9-like n=1 Tax=Danio aesculapii TaxID=1142201 RepID=UPI0024BF43DD|nr:4-galactosyl-N-acetylglucosaminide 3-alpha-L-fucosyltransferase 9-like [Danio aesculapii]
MKLWTSRSLLLRIMPSTNGSSLCHLGVMLALVGVVFLTVMFSWFSLSNCLKQYSTNSLNLFSNADKPILLLWVWPENYVFEFSDCKKFYNIDNCQLTDDRSLYNNSDAVIVYHRNISWDLSNLPPSPRPPFQKWIWLHLESPTNTKIIPGLENLFNHTLSYRQDADIPVRMRLKTRKKPADDFVIPKKDKLVCWIVSNNSPLTGVSARNRIYRELSRYIHVHLFGKAYSTYLDYKDYYPTLSSCKFYLSFENSIHKDYITEKINGPLAAGTVPVVLGPPRKNYENFIPGDAFIHVNDFLSVRSLARYLYMLHKNDIAYRRYFNWRKRLTPTPHLIEQTQEFILPICTACDYIARHREYKEAHDLYDWYFN